MQTTLRLSKIITATKTLCRFYISWTEMYYRDMQKVRPLSVVIYIGLFWTFCHASRSVRSGVKPASVSSIAVSSRSRMGPAPKLGQRVVHPLSMLKRRAALVTKPGATNQRASTHPTSIAPPYQGGPPLASTRVIRTTSVTTSASTQMSTGGATTTGPTSTGSTPTTATSSTSSTGSTVTSTTTVVVASTSTAASTSSFTTTLASTSSTTTSGTTSTSSTTSTATICIACTYDEYHHCLSPSPSPCTTGHYCKTGFTCSYNPAISACGSYPYCCQ